MINNRYILFLLSHPRSRSFHREASTIQPSAFLKFDVAKLGWAKPSVCHAVATLRDGGFLTMDEDYFLHLTDMGREVAEKIYERHQFFTMQLITVGVDPEIAEYEACLIEHAVSQDSFEKIRDAHKQEK